MRWGCGLEKRERSGEGHRDDTGDWIPWHCHRVILYHGGMVLKYLSSAVTGNLTKIEDMGAYFGGLAVVDFRKRGMADAGPGLPSWLWP